MLIVLGQKNKGLKRPMNLSGVSKFVYGNNNNSKNLHTHNNTTETYIDHTVRDTRRNMVKDVFVVNADSTR